MLVISGFGAQSETQSALQKRVDDFINVFGKTPTTYVVYRFFRSLAAQFEFPSDAVPLLKAKLDPLQWPDRRLEFASSFAGTTTTPEIEEALDAAVRTVFTFDDLKNWLRQFPAEPPVIRQIAGGRAQIIPSADPRAALFNEVAVADALEAITAEEQAAASRAATTQHAATTAQSARAKRRKIAIGTGIALGVVGLGALAFVLGRRHRTTAAVSGHIGKTRDEEIEEGVYQAWQMEPWSTGHERFRRTRPETEAEWRAWCRTTARKPPVCRKYVS